MRIAMISFVIVTLVCVVAGSGPAHSAPMPGKEKPIRLAPRAAVGEPAAAKTAAATIEARSGSHVAGRAVFTEREGQIVLELTVENAPPGLHAVHIHEKGDCSAPDAMSAGSHWNPTGEAHGMWGHPPYHRGDIGNLEVGKDGKGTMMLATNLWTISGAPEKEIAGRSIVIHANPDDFVTQPAGNSGARIGCGVIEPVK